MSIISVLSTFVPGIKIESLEELATKHKSLRIYAGRPAKWAIENSRYADELMHRVDYLDFLDDKSIVEKNFQKMVVDLVSGSHVYMSSRNGFFEQHSVFLTDQVIEPHQQKLQSMSQF